MRRELLRGRAGASPAISCKPITLGANTDPYQPIERKLGLTRRILEVLRDFRHPRLHRHQIGAGAARHRPVWRRWRRERLAAVAVSLTTLDRGLARRLEPRAATPERRLETIAALAQAGIPVAVMASPMIPALNDARAGAHPRSRRRARARRSAGYILLRLPLEIAPMFEEWLAAHVPGKAKHVMSLIRQSRGGKAYDVAMGHAHARHRPLCRDAAHPLRARLPALRPRRAAAPGSSTPPASAARPSSATS